MAVFFISTNQQVAEVVLNHRFDDGIERRCVNDKSLETIPPAKFQ